MTAATTGSEAEGKPQRACKGKRYKEMVAERGLKSFKRERKVKKCLERFNNQIQRRLTCEILVSWRIYLHSVSLGVRKCSARGSDPYGCCD